MSYPNPILNLDFANAKQLGDKVAFSRSSPATFWDRSGVLRTAVDGMPRFDHDPLTGICKGLLVEPQVPFLETYSEQFDSGAWGKSVGASVTPNTAIAPDGTMTADKVVHSSTNQGEYIYQSVAFTTGAISASCYLKSGEHKYSLVQFSDLAGASVDLFVDLDAGSVLTNTAQTPWTGCSYKIESVGNGWHKLCVWGVAAQGTTKALVIFPALSSGAIFAGNGSDGIYVWGAKLYAGTGPTSYLPSVASPVTRSTDLASVDLTQLKGAAGETLWNGSEGTIVVDYFSRPFGPINTVVSIDDGSFSNNIGVRSANGTLQHVVFSGGALVANLDGRTLAADTNYRSVLTWNSSSVGSSCNGSAVVTSGPGAPLNTNLLRIGTDFYGYSLNDRIRSIQLYNKRIADAYLPALSAL